MKAKYYIYRNLNKGGFSIRYKGKVIDHVFTLKGINVLFKISEFGRNRCIKEGIRNVHAYAVCDNIEYINIQPEQKMHIRSYQVVRYNPFKNKTFMVSQKRSIYSAKKCLFVNNKCIV